MKMEAKSYRLTINNGWFNMYLAKRVSRDYKAKKPWSTLDNHFSFGFIFLEISVSWLLEGWGGGSGLLTIRTS